MNMTTTLIFLLVATGQQPMEGTHSDQAAKAKSQRLLELHTNDAASYSIYRDVKRTEKLELRREPVYRWTNRTRVGGQLGEVYVWTYRGRPEVVASIFSHPTEDGRRLICHELHSLSLAVLIVDREASEQCVPQAAGVNLKVVEGAPPPASTAAQRLGQKRSLAREFTARSMSAQGQAWELRLLPQPLHRYESSDPDVLDGALFTMVWGGCGDTMLDEPKLLMVSTEPCGALYGVPGELPTEKLEIRSDLRDCSPKSVKLGLTPGIPGLRATEKLEIRSDPRASDPRSPG